MAQNKTLKIDAGADYFFCVRLLDLGGDPIGLTGCSARLMLKREYDSSPPLVSLTSGEGGGITFERYGDDSAETDACCVHLTAEQTGMLVNYTVKDTEGEVQPGEGYYDLEIDDADGRVVRAVGGMWIAAVEVTR